MSWAVSPFPWFGGKQRLCRRIADLLPQHLVYVEPFGGAAAVLLAKPRARLDVYNDVDQGLVNFFRVLRDRPDELTRLIELTPFSRTEFELCRDTWRDVADELERARRWYVRVEQAFGGTPTTSGWAGEFAGRRRASRAQTSLTRLERLPRIVARLRTVQIEDIDWRRVLERYDGPDCVFYLDPPYPMSVRRPNRQAGNRSYAHELTELDHVELVERVLELQADVLVSGYDTPLYRPLEHAGFERFEYAALACSQNRGYSTDRRRRVEVLWRRTREAERLFPVGVAERARPSEQVAVTADPAVEGRGGVCS